MSEEMKLEKDSTIENGTIIESMESTADSISQPPKEAASEPSSQPQYDSVPEAEIPEEDFPEEPADEQKPKHRFFRFRNTDAEETRDRWILSRIDNAHLMEYLTLEQKRFEQQQAAKETREKRLFTAFRLTISLAAIVAIVYLLKDNPTILVNILYIAGILAAIWFLKNPKDK